MKLSFVLFLSLFVAITLSGGGGRGGRGGGSSGSKKSSGSTSGSKKSSGSQSGSKKSSGSTSGSTKSSGSRSGGGRTWATTPNPTDYVPTNDELCGCYQLDLVCAPVVNNDEICYYYLLTSDSDDDYCDSVQSLTLSTDNDCQLTSADIDEYVLDYAPKCYDIDPLDADGIKLTLDSRGSGGRSGSSSTKSGGSSSTKSGGASSTKSGGASSSKTGSGSTSKTGGGSYGTSSKTGSNSGSTSGSSTKSGGSSSGSSSGGGSGGNSSPDRDDYIIFSVCFNATKVGGFNQNGQIGYGTIGGGSYTCDTPDLPDFCGSTTTTTTTASPTTSNPTSAAPTTANPTTDNPTTSAPTTANPTTSNPTSAAPTTTNPTTANPTSSAPTTSNPTSSSPTTATPTTSSPTSQSPTTSNPTTSDPTTASPTTAAPTTANPTTSQPTTRQPTQSPTTSEPTTNEPTTGSPTVAPTTDEPTTSQPTTSSPTTLQPSLAPSFIQCEATDNYNIAFLLDESGSVSDTEWDVIINFVKRIINFDVSPGSYVSLYEFASLPGFDQFLDFTGPKATTETQMQAALDGNNWNAGGITETWDAVNRVLDDFWTYSQILPNYNRQNILFLVTDGNPTDRNGDETRPQDFISDDYDTCPYIEDRLRNQFPNNYVDIVLIIIDPDSIVDTSKIDCLDYENGGEDIIPIESFGSAAFTAIEERIREKICTSGNVPPEGAPPGTPEWEYCLIPSDPTNCTVGLGPVPDGNGGGNGCSNDPNSANPCNP